MMLKCCTRISLFLLCSFLFFFSQTGYGQQTKPVSRTSNTSHIESKDPAYNPQKKIRHILKSNTHKILLGNKCMEDFTHRMGFQYIVNPKGGIGSMNGLQQFFHNMGVKFIILLKNGPFWKAKVNKRYKECRQKSGDFVG